MFIVETHVDWPFIAFKLQMLGIINAWPVL